MIGIRISERFAIPYVDYNTVHNGREMACMSLDGGAQTMQSMHTADYHSASQSRASCNTQRGLYGEANKPVTASCRILAMEPARQPRSQNQGAEGHSPGGGTEGPRRNY